MVYKKRNLSQVTLSIPAPSNYHIALIVHIICSLFSLIFSGDTQLGIEYVRVCTRACKNISLAFYICFVCLVRAADAACCCILSRAHIYFRVTHTTRTPTFVSQSRS